MLNKFILIIFSFLISGTIALSQSLVIRADNGLGTFQMQDLKDFQVSLIPDLGVNVESLSKFPPYFGYGITLVNYFRSGIGLGITSDYFSTGATNYYEDYSGSYKLNILTHAYNLGAVFSIRRISMKHLNTYLEIQQGIKSSRLLLSEGLIIKTPVSSHSYDLMSSSYWIKPLYRVEYKLFDFLSAGAFLGAEINLKSKLHLEGDRSAILKNKEGENVTINWSGVRFGLYLSGNILHRKGKDILPSGSRGNPAQREPIDF